MIYYFSGIGNSRYTAHCLGDLIKEEVKEITKEDPAMQSFSGDTLGFVFPVYSWGVAPIVIEFISKISESFIQDIISRGIKVWMVCTYGDETGNTAEILSSSLNKRGVRLSGAWGVRMPNTYVLLPGFDIDSKEEEKNKLTNATRIIPEVATKIKMGKWEWNLHRGSFPGLRTRLIYPLFVNWGINPGKWHHTEACIKCGVCVKKCQINNIEMKESGPEWGTKCISCLACFHYCPVHAVEYGKITKNKGQYVFPDGFVHQGN